MKAEDQAQVYSPAVACVYYGADSQVRMRAIITQSQGVRTWHVLAQKLTGCVLIV